MAIYRENNNENTSNNITISNIGGRGRKAPQKFFKENYIKAVEIITPSQYTSYNEQDSTGWIRPTEQLINLLLSVGSNIGTLFPISSILSDQILDNVSNISGFPKLLVKQNNLTHINPTDFNEKILHPLGRSFSDFAKPEDFYGYLTSGFLSSIKCIEGTAGDITLPAEFSAFGVGNVDRHRYLSRYLSWVYFLNRKDKYAGSVPSAYINKLAAVMTDKFTNNKPIILVDCVKLFVESLYTTQATSSLFTGSLTHTAVSADDINRLDTLCDIVFSPLFLDSNDTKVKTSFENLKISPTFRYTEKVSDNPFARLLDAVSFSIADTTNRATELETLTNIDLCPDQFLPYLADLIGWKLLGYNPNNWRLQLKNAVEVQKSRGTKKSIQLMLDMLFGQGAIIHSNDIKELWESYVPHLLLFAIATDSSLFRDGFASFTPQVAQGLGVVGYSSSSLEDNIRSCVDRILHELVLEEPDNFKTFGSGKFPRPYFRSTTNTSSVWNGDWHFISGTYYTGGSHDFTSVELVLQNDPANLFRYRGKVTSIPPFEEYGYYSFVGINSNLAYAIKFKLKCFGVSDGVAGAVAQYLLDNAVNNFELSSMNQGFLVFTKDQTIPPNYDAIVTNSTHQTKLDRLKYLTLWSGKSSHFSLVIDSALIDFTKKFYNASSIYGIREISNILKDNVPAHAIPKLSLYSNNSDSVDGMSLGSFVELSEKVYDPFIGSAGLAHGYQVSSWNIAEPTGITRAALLTNTSSIFSGAVSVLPRNLLRRRDKRNFLPRGGYMNRAGMDGSIRNPSGSGYALYTSAAPTLGYISAKNKFVPVPLKQGLTYPMTKLLDRESIHPVWSRCEDLDSSSIFNLSGISVYTSSTYPVRGLNIGDVSANYLLKTRDDIDPILALEHKVGYYDKILHGYYLLSSYWQDGSAHSTSATFPVELGIEPITVSSWFSLGDDYDVIRSLANYLDYLDCSSVSMSKYDEFAFGRKFIQLFGVYNNSYSGTLSALNIDELDNNAKFKPSILSHAFGPYIYNGSLFEEGANSSSISRKMDREEKDISYGNGVGALSPFTANTQAISLADGAVGYPEYSNSSIVNGIGLIDTSSIRDIQSLKRVFSVFKIPLSGLEVHSNKVPIWARNDLFLDSMAIKYTRPFDNGLPRVRVTINPTGVGNHRNFLLPNNEYKLKIRALSASRSGNAIGGNSLCAWIHTNPIGYPSQGDSNKKMWSFYSGKWRSSDLGYLSGTAGISLVSNHISMARQFSIGSVNSLNSQPLVSTQVVAERTCQSYIPEVITEISEPTLPEITNDMFEVLEYDFNTFDNTGDIFYTNNTPINTSSTVYNIDLLLKNSNADRFIIIDSIWVENVTLQNLAKIKTTYGEYPLNKIETKTCLEYFNDLSKGGLSRSPFYSSGVMMSSNGGHRASYRTSYGLYDAAATQTGSAGQTTLYNIVE